MPNLTITASPSRRRLPFTGAEFHSVITINPGDIETQPAASEVAATPARQPLDITILLDTSGSMDYPAAGASGSFYGRLGGRGDGNTRLDYAKRAIERLIDLAQPEDTVSLFDFSYNARMNFSVRMDSLGKASARAALTRLTSGGDTNLQSGLEMAFGREQFGMQTRCMPMPGALKRAFIFTDGETNRGMTDVSSLVGHLRSLRGSTGVSTFGFGSSHNASLLRSLATEGGGNYHFISDAGQIASAFGLELGAAASTVGTGSVLTLDISGRMKVLEVVNDLPVTRVARKAGERITIQIPDLLAGSPFHVVLRMSSLPRVKPLKDTHVAARVAFTMLSRGASTQSASTNLRVGLVPRGEHDEQDDSAMSAIIVAAQGAKVQALALAQARSGNLAGARLSLSSYTKSARAAGATAIADAVQEVSEAYTTTAAFASRGAFLSESLGRGMTRQAAGTGNAAFDAHMANDAQRTMKGAFTMKAAPTQDDMPDVDSMVTSK